MVDRRRVLRDRIIGVLLRNARQSAGRTKAECADALGVAMSRIEAYEQGHISISLPELEVLGYLLETPLDRFWERDPELKGAKDRPDFQALLDLRHRIIGVLLRQARLRAEMTQEELAQRLDLSPDRISDYEQGRRAIPVTELELLASRLHLPLNHFLDGQKGTVGEWHRQQELDRNFHELPAEVQKFVTKPVNIKYLEVAMRLSQMPASKLRGIAEGLLEITY